MNVHHTPLLLASILLALGGLAGCQAPAEAALPAPTVAASYGGYSATDDTLKTLSGDREEAEADTHTVRARKINPPVWKTPMDCTAVTPKGWPVAPAYQCGGVPGTDTSAPEPAVDYGFPLGTHKAGDVPSIASASKQIDDGGPDWVDFRRIGGMQGAIALRVPQVWRMVDFALGKNARALESMMQTNWPGNQSTTDCYGPGKPCQEYTLVRVWSARKRADGAIEKDKNNQAIFAFSEPQATETGAAPKMGYRVLIDGQLMASKSHGLAIKPLADFDRQHQGHPKSVSRSAPAPRLILVD